jgi:hypothetical protein
LEYCENCKRCFNSVKSLIIHVTRHKEKECYKFYINKYKIRTSFPWNKLSDDENNSMIICECCNTGCRGQRGISHHILQYKKDCFNFYISKYGNDRTNWPEETHLKIRTCIDCGSILKDPRTIEYCAKCRHNNHNVMKSPEVVEKNKITMKPIRESLDFRNKISKKNKERFENNPKLAEKQKEYMLNGGAVIASSKIRNPPEEQVILFELVKELYPSSIMNYPLIELNYCLDIVIPEYKIAIEHDGSYHKHTMDYDLIRQKKCEEQGWVFIRYNIIIPNKEELVKDINQKRKGISIKFN